MVEINSAACYTEQKEIQIINGFERVQGMEKKTLVKKLEAILDYRFRDEDGKDSPFIILGPDRTKVSKLRVYAYGGRIGRLRTKSGEHELLAEEYEKYLTVPEKAKKLTEMLTTADKDNLISSDEYLELAAEAAKARFKKKNRMSGERRIQTTLIKKNMKGKTGWCVIDMEFRVTPKDGLDKHSQVDIVVYDEEKGFGFIELKFNNESCDNLVDHCRSYHEICSKPKLHQAVEKELIRRAGYLAEYELIVPRYYDSMNTKIEKEGSIKLWYGCLFINGGKTRTQKLIKQIGEAEEVRKSRFSYADIENDETPDIDLRYEKLKSYTDFLES